MWILSLLPTVFASTDAPVDVSTALSRCSGTVRPLPTLSADQLRELDAGKVVRILQHGDPELPSTAIGIAVLSASRSALWIAAQDPHTHVDASLTEFIVRHLGPDHALWYGYYDLPWPLKDRQWVVESKNTHRLAVSSGGSCWEHTWQLVEDGLQQARPFVAEGRGNGVTIEQLDSAIFTPINHGSWVLAELSAKKTLVLYQATSVVGGAIPDGLVVQLTMARLESVLRDLETRANTWSIEHYRASHAPVLGGDGKSIQPFD